MAAHVVGIGGGSGAGKSTLARLLALTASTGVPALVLELDWYYRDLAHLTAAERAQANFDHPDALDWPLLLEHVGTLRMGQPVARPAYDFATHSRLAASVVAAPAPLLIVEGLLALYDPGLRSLLDLKVFVDVAREVRFARRLRRDVVERGRTPHSVEAQFGLTVDPMHRLYVEPSRAFADWVADGSRPFQQEVETIVARLALG